jgi:hypothetical protein
MIDECRHLPYNVTMDRNKAWLPPVRDGATQPEHAATREPFQEALRDTCGICLGAHQGSLAANKEQQKSCGFKRAALFCNLGVA